MDQAGSTPPIDDGEGSKEDESEELARDEAALPESAGEPEIPDSPAEDIALQSTWVPASSADSYGSEDTGASDGANGAHSPDLDEEPTLRELPGRSPEDLADDIAVLEELPTYVPSTPPVRLPRTTALELERLHMEARRWARRRRRYTLFIRRSARARRAARTSTISRVAWATVFALLALVLASLTTTVSAASAYYSSEYGLIQGLQRQVASKDSVRIYDDKGHLLYQINTDGVQHSITLADVPVDVVNATVAIEDHDYWSNQGVSFVSIARAAQADLESGSAAQGGSTITQQLIKQQILNSDVTFTRKLDEAILAVGMTENGVYTKAQILEMYLNSIPYSPTAYGIDAAAQEYFDYQDNPATGETAAQHLDLAQASMLAGIPQNPNLNDPLLNFAQARNRQAVVLNDMVQYGYITQAQANAAWVEAGKPNFFHPVINQPDLAPSFVDYIRSVLNTMITTGQLRNVARSGLNIYTTLDLGMQNAAQQAIDNHLYGDDTGGYGTPIKDANVTNAAVLLADQHTGDIKVMLGSANYNNASIDGQFNNVTQGFRGPGSSFKPFVYAAAFEKGWFPAMSVNDDPTTFWDPGSGTRYQPLDYDLNEATGQVTLRTALDWSLNIPAVKVMQFAGIQNVENLVERMGITQWQGTWGLSSVLGALDVTPFEMVQAYTVFANYGYYIPLHGINEITDSSGNVLYRYTVPVPVQVMDPRIAFLITSILSDNASRAGDFGPCSPLYLDPKLFGPHFANGDQSFIPSECNALYEDKFLSSNAWPTASKTGTSQNFDDDWTMGYTMDFTGGVWVGNDNNTPMQAANSNVPGIDGITGAAPIWYHSMVAAEEQSNSPKTPFPVPSGVRQMRYCSHGLCTTDWFLDNYTPPSNLGETPESVPCVAILPSGGWTYSSHGCQVAQVHKLDQNNGAPPPIPCTMNGKREDCIGAPD